MIKSDEYQSKIDNIHYEYSMGLDGAIQRIEALRKNISNAFNEPSFDESRISLNEACDLKNQEVITECLKDLLLYRKERLSKLRIEYIITSIFDYIFRDFNLSRALETLYGPSYKETIEDPNYPSTMYCYIWEQQSGFFSKITLLNNVLPFIKIQESMNDKPIIYFEVISKAVVNKRNIYLLKSNDRYLIVEQLTTVPDEDGLLMHGGEVVPEAEASERFFKLQEEKKKS